MRPIDVLKALGRLARHYVWADNPKELRWPILHTASALLWMGFGIYMVSVAFRSRGWLVPAGLESLIAGIGYGRLESARHS